MKTLLRFLLGAALIAPGTPTMAQVDYRVTNVGGSAWQYDYTITNTHSVPVNEFTVFFNQSQFSSLTEVSSPTRWSSIVAQPDAGLPADGFFDALSLTAGLLPGASRSGFSVKANYSGAGSPSTQLFNIVDSVTFEILNFGDATPSVSSGAATADQRPARNPKQQHRSPASEHGE